MRFENDFFISFCHADNTPKGRGWVARFHERFAESVWHQLGRKPKIWRDEKELTGNDALTPAIEKQLPKTAFLITIVTPSYKNSHWCTKELELFVEAARERGELQFGDKVRIIKIVKTPIDRDELPEVLRDMLGFEFYEKTGDGEVGIPLDPEFGPEYEQKLNRETAWLALKVAPQLKAFLEGSVTDAEPAPDKPVVYLAETSYDIEQERLDLVRKLTHDGFRVLPDARLPADEDDCVEQVQKDLAQCQLSIHMIGSKYLPVLNGPAEKSSTDLQNELAAARSRESGLRRLIWLPDEVQSTDEEQLAFIETIRKDSEAQFGADVIAQGAHTLEQAARAQLEALADPARPEAVDAPKTKALVYVICDERDREAVKPVRRALKDAGLDSRVPLFEGTAEQIRQDREARLAHCDAVLLYWGSGDAAWRSAVESDLLKVAAYRDGRPNPVVFTYVAEPTNGSKDDAIDFEDGLLDGRGGPPEAVLAQLFQALLDRA